MVFILLRCVPLDLPEPLSGGRCLPPQLWLPHSICCENAQPGGSQHTFLPGLMTACGRQVRALDGKVLGLPTPPTSEALGVGMLFHWQRPCQRPELPED